VARMACADHKRLVEEYVDFVRKNIKAGDAVQDKKSEEWRRATNVTRRACEIALDALSRHRNTHRC
jgi:hypothetical protein